MKYNLKEVEDFDEWDKYIEESPQGSIFMKHAFLKASGREFKCLYVCKGTTIWAGVPLILKDKGCEIDLLIIYNSIWFNEKEMPKETRAKIERFNITEFLIGILDKHYKKIELALSPEFEDMRPFMWHKYDSKNPFDKFQLDLRYTSYLDLTKDLIGNTIKIRRSQLKEAKNAGARLEETTDVRTFIKYYKTTQPNVKEDYLEKVRVLLGGLVGKKQVVMYALKEKNDEISYMIVWVLDSKRAYALFAAGNPNIKNNYKGTAAYWESFNKLRNLGIKEVDLEGVNSPQRGWFKLSFGGDLRKYYKVRK